MIDNLITAAFGILITLMGFGKILVSRNTEKNQEYLKKFGKILRIGGIILMVVGLFLAMSNAFVR